MGGVVNIITRHHKQEGRRTQARVMYGSYNTQKYMVNNGFNVGKFSSLSQLTMIVLTDIVRIRILILLMVLLIWDIHSMNIIR